MTDGPLTVRLTEQTAADLAQIVRRIREVGQVDPDPAFDARLRNAHMALESALRSVGWTPSEDGWVKQEVRRRGR